MTLITLADYSILQKSTFDDVYEPAEDSFVLIDALEKDLSLIQSLSPTICLEIGSGSGVVISSLAKVLKNTFYMSTDLNPIAAFATKATSESNGVSVNVVISDLASVLLDRLKNSVDLLICNPPYSVTPSEEVGGSNLQKAYSGGIKGREVINRIIPLVPQILSKEGLFYLVCIVQNDIEDIEECLNKYGLKMTKVIDRRCPYEHLFALRFSFKENNKKKF